VVLTRVSDARRGPDLFNISQNLGSLNRQTFKTAAEQQELANLVRRVRSQPIP
jgi:hypothetical protein